MYRVPMEKRPCNFRCAGNAGQPGSLQIVPPLNNEKAAVEKALASPIGSSPLRKLPVPAIASVLFSRHHRSCPEPLLVPPILAELKAAGVRDEDITFIMAIWHALGLQTVRRRSEAWPTSFRIIDD